MVATLALIVAAASLIGWLVLVFARGGFWRCDQRLRDAGRMPASWPDVTAVIPARDEVATIGHALASLLAQDYPGVLRIIVVDDNSTDGTADAARRAAQGSERVHVLTGTPLPAAWTGKLWAVHQGIRHATVHAPAPYLWLTDADIVHGPATLRRLVANAEAGQLSLVSLMVRLHCRSLWERLLVPAFIFFFQKLVPFPWVNDANSRIAAAAGGCILVRSDALARSGGIAAIRGRLIDDCALAGQLKQEGGIWLGLADDSLSLRAYCGLTDFWAMVARTAYAYLNLSPFRLLLSVAGMLLLYAVPPLAIVVGAATNDGGATALGVLATGLMICAYRPTVELYDLPSGWTLTLPMVAVLYVAMTIDSARLTWLGRGGHWKGRSFAASPAHRPFATGTRVASEEE